MQRGRRAAGRLAVALGLMVTLFVAVPNTAEAWESLRHDKCTGRANVYAADEHPDLTPQEIAERTAWLYAQCAENDAVEAFAEEQGSMAPALFPNTDGRQACPSAPLHVAQGRQVRHAPEP